LFSHKTVNCFKQSAPGKIPGDSRLRGNKNNRQGKCAKKDSQEKPKEKKNGERKQSFVGARGKNLAERKGFFGGKKAGKGT
jgi:hypothetical protein